MVFKDKFSVRTEIITDNNTLEQVYQTLQNKTNANRGVCYTTRNLKD
jgi:hypothetical protein